MLYQAESAPREPWPHDRIPARAPSGFRSFNDLLREAEKRGLLRLEPDEKSGGYIVREVEEV